MIKVREIFFKYAKENKEALSGINMNILNGESVALLGFNGSGKSTLLKVMLGILSPREGEISYDDINISNNRIRIVRDIGVVWGQKSNLWWDVSVKRSLHILKKIYKLTDKHFETKINELDSKLEIRKYWDKPLRKLSLGQRVKCEIAAATLHNPSILFFDEPFIGLDFITRNEIIKLLKEYKQNNRNSILVLTSHNIKDIEELCSRVILMESGLIIWDNSIDNIQKKFYRKTISIKHNNENLNINSTFNGINIEKVNIGFTKVILNNIKDNEVMIIKELLELNDIIDIQLEDTSL
ncbi:MAG: ATP-binding cassette domain-containing protein, partial [Erysipelotrichaceae bacterium]